MFKNVELYKQPLDIFEKMPQYRKYCEMSEFEQSFLCGLLKEKKPKKVLEIGVSAGGTTAVILNCLSLLGNEAEMYSIDLCNTYYINKNLSTGFVAEEAKKFISDKVKHTLFSGNISPAFIEKVGRDIDFLIIDTAHVLPGEMLDFLLCLPYLSSKAVVVLHDISLNISGNCSEAYATKLLFDTVTADKYFMEAPDKAYKFPNIAAFQITEDTYKYIGNVFSALTITWSYMPEKKHLELYREFFDKEYEDKELIYLYDKAVDLQTYRICKNFKENFKSNFEVLLAKWKAAKHFVIYGYGTYGLRFYDLAIKNDLPVDCFVVSDDFEIPKEIDVDIPVKHLKDLSYKQEECTVLLTVGSPSAQFLIIDKLIKLGYVDIV